MCQDSILTFVKIVRTQTESTWAGVGNENDSSLTGEQAMLGKKLIFLLEGRKINNRMSVRVHGEDLGTRNGVEKE